MVIARRLLRGLAVVAVGFLCMGSLHADVSGAAAAPFTTTMQPQLDPALLDRSCAPCDDFYTFATGGFAKKYPIPAAFPSWDTFSILADDNTAVLRQILEEAAADTSAPAGSNQQKIGAYYGSCMDTGRIDAAGLAPVQPALAMVAAITDVPSLVRAAGSLKPLNVDIGWTLDSTADLRESAKTTADVGPSRLGMPDRDYYLENDDRTAAIRAAYLTYVTTIMGEAGLEPAAAASAARNILALETVLARATPSRADLRDPNRTYHPMPLTAVQQLAPAIDWSAYASATGAPPFTLINVELPDYLTVLNAQLAATPLQTWKQYAIFQIVNTYATTLPKRFDDAHFAFYATALAGTKEQLPRYKRCVRATDRALGEALGAEYVERVFPPAAKARARALVDNVQAVLAGDIRTLSWMAPTTKARAETKLAAYGKKIGYPDRFRDYSRLHVDAGAPYATNAQAAQRFEVARELAKIDKPTDRTEWDDTPPTVNAYYAPSNNEILFPAGILQPPFFGADNDDALNYGAIGAVIGHEMTHGFDDQGRQFDEHGNQSDWWTAADAARFKARAQCIVDEFNGFEVQPGVHENGRLVLGEAIADLGGLTIAYKAFERTAEFRSGAKIDGFTPQQRFFLAFARIWAATRRPEFQRQLVKVDPHPDDRFRVNGTLANMPEFRAAFGCNVGDKMVRAPACSIW